ncbi:hypothetical protein LK537_09990 [Lachnoclostridium pacaense]|uniref:hypothetical protein n=1 Tax=Enterocloster hominis (ex Hitch et al. 2024) TaxID=1917870 RepID=UPI001D101D49|nr:hypothetical protein [Lachnoclostridium pacaense]MCC2817619.1 hypothetical protein [Lachnoclostridium pacaense]
METKERSRTRIGFSRMEKKYEWKDHVIFMGILLAMAVWVNRNIEIKGLYMDDLYFWSCYGEQGFLQYVFPLGSTRFRFLYYLAAWLEMAVVGNHVNWFVPFNILLNTAVAWSVYLIGRRLSRSKGIGFLCGFMYLISRMAYYQIGQVLGLMETMALWMAIGILWYLYRYMNGEDGRKYYYLSCALYFGVCFVHERYMVLFPLLLLVLLIKRSKNLAEWAAGLVSFLLVQVIRAFTIGSVLPAGTGGTQVADTFSLADTVRYGLSQIAYVFGMNAGPEHLNGRPWGQSPLSIRILVLLADMAVAVIVLGFLIKVIKDKRKDVKGKVLCNLALFLLFIGACIASSSVTIRVEMRWVYVSLTAALLLLAYMYGVLTEGVKPELYLKRLWPWGAAFICYVFLMLPVELFYRAQYPNLYLWPSQLRYNSLAEETYGRYGDSLFGKNIYIIGNSYEMSDFTARTFFKVFDKERTAEGTSVEFIDSIRDIGLVDDRMLVLREDPEHNGFQDITQFVKDLKLNVEYGYYDDGWMDEHASLTVMAGETGMIDLEIIYPGVMSGGEGIKITKDQDDPVTIPVRSTVVNETIEAEPWQMVHLTFDYNFYMHNAQEQRGKDRLAAIVHMTAR